MFLFDLIREDLPCSSVLSGANVRGCRTDFGLLQLEFTSFVRVTGYQSLLSASDTSYALSALLECEQQQQKGDQSTASKENGGGDDDDDQAFFQSFNAAFDALNSNAAPPSLGHLIVGHSQMFPNRQLRNELLSFSSFDVVEKAHAPIMQR